MAQVPQGFNYQAIARDGSGNVIPNQPLPVKIDIVDALTSGNLIYEELFSSVTSNQFGLISLVVGTGAPQSGGKVSSFSAIDWKSKPLYIRTIIEYPGTTWTTMGTSQIMSVPYSLLAKDVQGPVTSIPSLGITGTTDVMDSALFEVRNKAGNLVFAVYNEGVRAYVGNGSKGAKGGFAVGGYDGTKDGSQHNLLYVTSDSVRVYVDSHPSTKGNRGGFSVGGYDMTKGTVQDYLNISKDSARIYVDTNPLTKGVKGGFSVGGYDMTKGSTSIQDLLDISKDSARIYVDSNPLTKGVKGGFSVGGYDMTKGGTVVQDMLDVSKDSVRVYVDSNPATKGVRGGFSVGGYDMTKGGSSISNYLNIETNTAAIINPAENRLLWYPLKNAFLTGRVLITDTANVGVNSFATGYESEAKGRYSQAMGFRAAALGDYSTAIGNNAAANNNNSFAFGESAAASNEGAFAFGYGSVASMGNSYAFGKSSSANGLSSYAFGEGVTAGTSSAGNCYAFGKSTQATGIGSYAFGDGAISSGISSYSFGSYGSENNWTPNFASNTIANGNYSFAAGQGALAFGDNSISIGYCTRAEGQLNIAMGYGSWSYGNRSCTAIGEYCRSTGLSSLAMGYWSWASGQGSVALGWSTASQNWGSATMGYFTQTNSNFCTAIGRANEGLTNSMFEIGNGTYSNYNPSGTRVNILTVLNNGNMGLGTSAPSERLEIGGSQAKISFNSSISNMLLYNSSGIGPPTFTSRGTGTKIILFPSLASSAVDYAMGIDNSTLWYSVAQATNTNSFKFYAGTTEIMRITGDGRVGIGTTAPGCTLDIGTQAGAYSGTFGFLNPSGQVGTTVIANGSYSIHTAGRILCPEYNAVSDARIKEIIDYPEGEDNLALINKLKVTDFRYIDKVGNGNSIKQGFIAQDVEKVLPEAVHTSEGYIPDIYQLAKNFSKTEDGNLLITVDKSVNLEKGDMLKLILPTGAINRKILEINSSHSFTTEPVEGNPQFIFVYGKEVNDFRSLDYDRIFTIGIGAVQELSRENDQLRAEVQELKEEIAQVKTMVRRHGRNR